MNIYVYLFSNFIIHYILLKYLNHKYQLRKSKNYMIIIFVICITIISFVNLLGISILNLIVSLISYLLYGYAFFELHLFKDYMQDFLFFFLLILIDSLCFFITGVFYKELAIQLTIFRIIFSSILLLFLDTLITRVIKNIKTDNIPRFEWIIFLLSSIFSLFIIFILSKGYDVIKSQINEFIVFFLAIGVILIDIVIIHYLDYINKTFEVEKQLIDEKRQQELLYQHYLDIKKSNHETRELIHDIKNHIQTICSAYAINNTSLVEKLINQFNVSYEKVKIKYKTGSDILDIILNDKYYVFKTKKIDFKFKSQKVDLSFIKEFDMITIFGNLLDNSIEANESVLGHKWIELFIYKVNNMLIIKNVNPCTNTIIEDKNTIISTKNSKRGYGISNIKKAVNHYSGDFYISIKDNKCTTLIIVPLEK